MDANGCSPYSKREGALEKTRLTSPKGLVQLGRSSAIGLVAFVGMTCPVQAQEVDKLPEHFLRYEGCYELRADESPGWVAVLEDGIQLTLVELASTQRVSVREFVVRAAPGEAASWYPKVSWLLIDDLSPLQISWEWPLFDWVTAVFPVDDWDGETPLEGEISHSTDVIGYDPDPVEVRLVRSECRSSHFGNQ